jgi:hypothetical protein
MFENDEEFDPLLILKIREQNPPPHDGGFFLLLSGKGLELENGYLMRLAGI